MKMNMWRFIILLIVIGYLLNSPEPKTKLKADSLFDELPPGNDIAALNDSSYIIDLNFRISTMGEVNDPDFDAVTPAVAYNSRNNQWLIVWSGSETVEGENEIWGHMVSAQTGSSVITDFKISTTGVIDNDPQYDAENPDVAYNPVDNEFLVVWSADHTGDGIFRIWGQRLSGLAGNNIGSPFIISSTRAGDDPEYTAYSPAVVYNDVESEFVVVYWADPGISPLVDGEYEIWAQRISAWGTLQGSKRLISDMGGIGSWQFAAMNPDIAYNNHCNNYLVVWCGDDNDGGTLDNEFEIYGQLLSDSLVELGENDFRISETGGLGDASDDATDPAISFNPAVQEFFVVYESKYNNGAYWNIGGRRIYGNGNVDAIEYLIDTTNDYPNPVAYTFDPAIANDTLNNFYFVVWHDDRASAGEYEIWGQQLNSSGFLIYDSNNSRYSYMGPEVNAAYDGVTAAIAYSEKNINKYLIVWSGDDSVDDEFEIWGQIIVGAHRAYVPAVMRD
jgi:hypothetical protein